MYTVCVSMSITIHVQLLMFAKQTIKFQSANSDGHTSATIVTNLVLTTTLIASLVTNAQNTMRT